MFIVVAHVSKSGRHEEAVKQRFRKQLQTLTDKPSIGEVVVIIDDMTALIGPNRQILEFRAVWERQLKDKTYLGCVVSQ